MGNPVAHSLSPVIHQAFAAQTGAVIRYEAVLVPVGGFDIALERFRARGGRGCNVTVPFKEQAWQRAERRSERAQCAGAVNTLVLVPGQAVFGDNTDGVGLLRDLAGNHGVELAGRRVLVLGAGGAARGILGPLLEQGPAAMLVANRSPGRAVALASRFAALGPIRASGLDALGGERFDLLVNATAAGLQAAVPALPDAILAPGALCYDLAYGAAAAPFLAWARARGHPAVDGLGMLVEQAAESFMLWRGIRPSTRPVLEQLRHAEAGRR